MAEPDRKRPASGGRQRADSGPTPIPLRIAMAGGRLGVELYQPVALGPLFVERLAYALPELKFPVDLSGGVRPFRHHRGDLQQLAITTSSGDLSDWLRDRCVNLLEPGAPPPAVWCHARGAGVGVVTRQGALAFDLYWAPTRGLARWVVANPRGMGRLSGAATAHILQLLDSTGQAWLKRDGRFLYVNAPAHLLARAVLPKFGARVPRVDSVEASSWVLLDDGARVTFGADVVQAPLDDEVCAAVELAQLVRQADELAARGAADEARASYLDALERAPREPQLVQTILEIDLAAGGRDQAALGLLSETLPATQAGPIGMELLLRIGDVNGAFAAVEHHCNREPFGPLTAAMWCRFAELSDDPLRRRDALDLAVAASPGSPEPRWSRVGHRLSVGDVDGAVSDAQHLEAGATGSQQRHQVLTRAARQLLDFGYLKDAGALFERALRYAPSDARATLGLGQALLESGQVSRAAALLERSLELSVDNEEIAGKAQLQLAKILAVHYRNFPHAIARVRGISGDVADVVEARALEGRWRAEVGDVVGASLAYARLRETCELEPHAAPARAPEWLCEAATFETAIKGDLPSAERHLATALRLAPHHKGVLARYRAAAKALADARSGDPARTS